MFVANHPQLVERLRETQQDFKFSPRKVVTKLGVLFQSVDHWDNGQIKLFPYVLKQMESQRNQTSKAFQNSLIQYFSERG